MMMRHISARNTNMKYVSLSLYTFTAGRIAAVSGSMIGSWHDAVVRLSVRPSVTPSCRELWHSESV